MVESAVFKRDGARFVPTAWSGSPWSDELVHGGPPAGLLARAIEAFADGEMRVVRLTIDLFRPVPKAPLEVAARSVREGKRIHVVDATITSGGVEISRASGLLLRATEAAFQGSGSAGAPPGPEHAEDRPPMGPRPDMPRREGFHTATEMRRLPRGESTMATTWFRVPELVEGESMSPLVRLASTCDFVNAVASMGSLGGPGGFASINTDSTIYVHRAPAGEWIALQVERTLEPYGIGVSGGPIFDQDGLVGRATQAVLANQMR